MGIPKEYDHVQKAICITEGSHNNSQVSGTSRRHFNSLNFEKTGRTTILGRFHQPWSTRILSSRITPQVPQATRRASLTLSSRRIS